MMMSDYLTARGDLYNAKGYTDKAIALSPQRASFYLRRARLTYMATGSAEKAADDLKQVRALFPKNPEYQVSDIELLTPPKKENKENPR
jgi:tetratricopeptide (TPR) repeat protein